MEVENEDLDDPLLGRRVVEAPVDHAAIEAAGHQQYAHNLRNHVAGGWLSCVVNSTVRQPIDADAFAVFRDQLLVEAGNPTDPMERMLIEQLAVAHMSIGQLRIRSCMAEMPKMSLAFADAAARLLGEFRRSTLALEEYRGKRAVRTQKNDSQVTPASTKGRMAPVHKQVNNNGNGKHRVTELASNDQGALPSWVKARMGNPIPSGSPPAAVTNGKRKG